MSAPAELERPERLTLRTALETADHYGRDPELRDLLDMALREHEPSPDARPECPSCLVAMPCDVWSYAETESRAWLFAELQAIVARVQGNTARHAAARRLGRPAVDLAAVRSDQPVAVPWVGDLR